MSVPARSILTSWGSCTGESRHLHSSCSSSALIAAALLAATGKLIHRRVADVVALASSTFVIILGWLLLEEAQRGQMVYWFGGWVPRDGIALGISFVVD